MVDGAQRNPVARLPDKPDKPDNGRMEGKTRTMAASTN